MIRLRSSSATTEMMVMTARPSGPPGIELFAEADELDVQVVQLVQYFQKVADGARQTVTGPYHHDIELAAAGIGQQLIQGRAAGPGAAISVVCVLVNDPKAALLGQSAKIVKLGFGVLVQGRDTQIKRRALHHCCPRAAISSLISPMRSWTKRRWPGWGFSCWASSSHSVRNRLSKERMRRICWLIWERERRGRRWRRRRFCFMNTS